MGRSRRSCSGEPHRTHLWPKLLGILPDAKYPRLGEWIERVQRPTRKAGMPKVMPTPQAGVRTK